MFSGDESVCGTWAPSFCVKEGLCCVALCRVCQGVDAEALFASVCHPLGGHPRFPSLSPTTWEAGWLYHLHFTGEETYRPPVHPRTQSPLSSGSKFRAFSLGRRLRTPHHQHDGRFREDQQHCVLGVSDFRVSLAWSFI